MDRDAIEQLEVEEKDAVAKKDYVEAKRLKNKIDEINTGTQGTVQERRHDSVQESIQERDAIQERHQDSVHEPQRDLLFDQDASGGAWSRFHIGTPTRTRAKPGRAPVTSLTRPASAGDTVLTVDDNHGFEFNDKILIGTELGTIVKFGSFHLARPLRHDHPAVTAVTRVEDEVANPPGLSTEKFGPGDPQDIRQLYKSFTTDAKHIKEFDGNEDKFTNWRKAIGDQMQRQRPWINKLIEWARKQQKRITTEIERGLAEASFNVNEASLHIWLPWSFTSARSRRGSGTISRPHWSLAGGLNCGASSSMSLTARH